MQPPPEITTHLIQIELATRDVTRGDITVEEFEALIGRIEKLLKDTRDEIMAIDIPADLKTEISEEMDVGQQGIDLYLEAIADFQEYIHSRILDRMQQGLDKARRANHLVNNALARNWETFYTYQQSTEEYLKDIGIAPEARNNRGKTE